MAEFFNPDLFIYKVKYWVIFGIIIIVILGKLYLPSGDFLDPYPNEEEKVALNFAATVAMTLGTYYANTDSTGFIGIKSGYDENNIVITDSIKINAPKGYKCEITDSIVVVTHIDGAEAEVRWR